MWLFLHLQVNATPAPSGSIAVLGLPRCFDSPEAAARLLPWPDLATAKVKAQGYSVYKRKDGTFSLAWEAGALPLRYVRDSAGKVPRLDRPGALDALVKSGKARIGLVAPQDYLAGLVDVPVPTNPGLHAGPGAASVYWTVPVEK